MSVYTWKDLPFEPHKSYDPVLRCSVVDGVQALLVFPNNWGVSVIKFGRGLPRNSSQGFCENLYELAVIDCNHKLRYDSCITNDVIGYLSEEEVVTYVNKVAALPAISPL